MIPGGHVQSGGSRQSTLVLSDLISLDGRVKSAVKYWKNHRIHSQDFPNKVAIQPNLDELCSEDPMDELDAWIELAHIVQEISGKQGGIRCRFIIDDDMSGGLFTYIITANGSKEEGRLDATIRIEVINWENLDEERNVKTYDVAKLLEQ